MIKKLSKNNIIQIVQIFDTDGAFIKKEFIEKGESSKFEYTLNSIRCKYPRKVEERNERKSKGYELSSKYSGYKRN